MNRFHPLKANASDSPTTSIDSHATPNQLFENACFRIRAAARSFRNTSPQSPLKVPTILIFID